MSSRIRYSPDDKSLLARLITGEAGGEGLQGMQHAGNVMVNRVVAGNDPNAAKTCGDFKGIMDIRDMVYQKPGGFEAVTKPPFYGPPNPDAMAVVDQVLEHSMGPPSTHALWFEQPPKKTGICNPNFFDTTLAGRFKGHCFYNPPAGSCRAVYQG